MQKPDYLRLFLCAMNIWYFLEYWTFQPQTQNSKDCIAMTLSFDRILHYVLCIALKSIVIGILSLEQWRKRGRKALTWCIAISRARGAYFSFNRFLGNRQENHYCITAVSIFVENQTWNYKSLVDIGIFFLSFRKVGLYKVRTI